MDINYFKNFIVANTMKLFFDNIYKKENINYFNTFKNLMFDLINGRITLEYETIDGLDKPLITDKFIILNDEKVYHFKYKNLLFIATSINLNLSKRVKHNLIDTESNNKTVLDGGFIVFYNTNNNYKYLNILPTFLASVFINKYPLTVFNKLITTMSSKYDLYSRIEESYIFHTIDNYMSFLKNDDNIINKLIKNEELSNNDIVSLINNIKKFVDNVTYEYAPSKKQLNYSNKICYIDQLIGDLNYHINYNYLIIARTIKDLFDILDIKYKENNEIYFTKIFNEKIDNTIYTFEINKEMIDNAIDYNVFLYFDDNVFYFNKQTENKYIMNHNLIIYNFLRLYIISFINYLIVNHFDSLSAINDDKLKESILNFYSYSSYLTFNLKSNTYFTNNNIPYDRFYKCVVNKDFFDFDKIYEILIEYDNEYKKIIDYIDSIFINGYIKDIYYKLEYIRFSKSSDKEKYNFLFNNYIPSYVTCSDINYSSAEPHLFIFNMNTFSIDTFFNLIFNKFKINNHNINNEFMSNLLVNDIILDENDRGNYKLIYRDIENWYGYDLDFYIDNLLLLNRLYKFKNIVLNNNKLFNVSKLLSNKLICIVDKDKLKPIENIDYNALDAVLYMLNILPKIYLFNKIYSDSINYGNEYSNWTYDYKLNLANEYININQSMFNLFIKTFFSTIKHDGYFIIDAAYGKYDVFENVGIYYSTNYELYNYITDSFDMYSNNNIFSLVFTKENIYIDNKRFLF